VEAEPAGVSLPEDRSKAGFQNIVLSLKVRRWTKPKVKRVSVTHTPSPEPYWNVLNCLLLESTTVQLMLQL